MGPTGPTGPAGLNATITPSYQFKTNVLSSSNFQAGYTGGAFDPLLWQPPTYLWDQITVDDPGIASANFAYPTSYSYQVIQTASNYAATYSVTARVKVTDYTGVISYEYCTFTVQKTYGLPPP